MYTPVGYVHEPDRMKEASNNEPRAHRRGLTYLKRKKECTYWHETQKQNRKRTMYRMIYVTRINDTGLAGQTGSSLVVFKQVSHSYCSRTEACKPPNVSRSFCLEKHSFISLAPRWKCASLKFLDCLKGPVELCNV